MILNPNTQTVSGNSVLKLWYGMTEKTNRRSSGEPLGMNVDALWLEALLWVAFLAAVGLGAVGVLGNGQLVYYHLPKMYRVTIQVLTNLLLTSKQKLRFSMRPIY